MNIRAQRVKVLNFLTIKLRLHCIDMLAGCLLSACKQETREVCKQLRLVSNIIDARGAHLSSVSNAMASEDATMEKKAALRLEAKQRLATLDSAEKTRQSEIVQNKLFAHDSYKNAKRVSIFLSIDDEIKTLPILKNMLDTKKSVFIPRYTTGKNCQMDMVRLNSWDDYESMPTTKWNIKQPSLSDSRESALETGGLDLVIMPGLAFTKEGQRLGRGKGHYDRFLNNYVSHHGIKPHTIAVAFKQQILQHIPTTETDFQINSVIFEEA